MKCAVGASRGAVSRGGRHCCGRKSEAINTIGTCRKKSHGANLGIYVGPKLYLIQGFHDAYGIDTIREAAHSIS